MGILWVLQNTSHTDTAAAAESPCSDVTRARVLDPDCHLVIVTLSSSLLMLVLSKLISTEYLVGIMWL